MAKLFNFTLCGVLLCYTSNFLLSVLLNFCNQELIFLDSKGKFGIGTCKKENGSYCDHSKNMQRLLVGTFIVLLLVLSDSL